MKPPSLAVLKVLVRELLTRERSPRVPEPDLVMDDPDKVAAYVRAGGEDGARASVYLYHSAQISDVIRPGDLVVDLACGPLNQLAIAARLNPETRFLGIDLSEGMLRIAQGTIDEMGLKNVALRRGDITRLDLPDGSVDAVISSVALHHLPTTDDLDRCFAEIDRVLKPGGGLYLADFGHLRSERSIRYFAYQYAHMQPELFVLDYWHSLRAAFPLDELKRAWQRRLARRARFFAMRPLPFLAAVKSESRRGDDPALLHKLQTRRRELSPFSQRDLSDILAFFAAAGLRAPGLERPIPRPFPFGVRPRGKLYAPDPAVFLRAAADPLAARPAPGPSRLTALAEAAVRAPSGGNAQPWKLVVDEAASRIDVFVNERVDTSPMNAGHRMSRLGVGAALESVLVAAHTAGARTDAARPVEGAVASVLVTIVSPPGAPVTAGGPGVLSRRTTNRRLYDGQPVDPEAVARLARRTPPLDGVTTVWLTDRGRLPDLAALLCRADVLAFCDRSIRQATLSKVRLDAPPEAEVEEGLPVASLELSPGVRRVLPYVSRLPGWIVRSFGLGRAIGAHTARQVESASGLCLVTAPDESAASDVLVGRALQRAWLALTEEGFASQPLTSLLVLENILYHGTRELATLGRGNIETLRDELRALLPEIAGARPGFLLRFGRAPAPSARSGRLPLDVTVSVRETSRPAHAAARRLQKKRILFVSEAVTLSTVARPATLARALDPQRFDVELAGGGPWAHLFRDLPFPVRHLRSISPEAFRYALETGAPLYDGKTLSGYVEDDLELLREVAPDVVVGDFRLSLSVSARRAGVPYLAITDSCWSPYAGEPLALGEHPLRRVLGSGAAKAVFGLVRSLALSRHGHALNRLRRQYGLPELGHDLRSLFTDADHVLYADVPELSPVFDAPPRHHFLGPVLWSAPVPLPSGFDRVDPRLPLVYVSLGSAGRADLLPEILAALGGLPVTVVAATAGRIRIDRPPANTLVADFVPAAQVLSLARLAVCNGGAPAAHQALAAGVPVLGITGNMNQIVSMRSVTAAGAGEAVETSRAAGRAVGRLAARMLGDPAYADAAASLARTLATYDAARRFRAIVDEALAKLTAAA